MTSLFGRARIEDGVWKRLSIALVSATGGVAAVTSPLIASLVGLGAIGTALAVVAPSWIAALAVPASFLTYRIGPDAASISVADAALLATLLALSPYLLRALAVVTDRQILWFVGLYLVAMVAPLVVNPSISALFEYAHRGFLVLGSILVGILAVYLDVHLLGLRLYVGVAAVFSAASMLDSVASGGGPAYPLGVTKNHAGGLIAVALLVLLIVPVLIRSRRARTGLFLLLAGGLVATQARAGIIALVAGLCFVVLVDAERRRQFLFPLVAVGVLSLLAVRSLDAERLVPEDVALNSTTERISFWSKALGDWFSHPALGNGYKYYVNPEYNFPVPYTDEFPDGGPPNPHSIVLQSIAESGAVGLVALIALLLGLLYVLRQFKSSISLAASAVLLATFAIGLFDIFWLAGRTFVPFYLVGVAMSLNGYTMLADFGRLADANR